jgi:hypothetical protein
MNHSNSSEPVLTAYRLPGARQYYKLRPADPDRYWMDISTGGWANRCLPLRMANQYGWEILNPSTFEVEWKDKPDLDSIKFDFKSESRSDPRSLFGFGTITWTVPYLFVTPPGWNLIVRGPTNFWRDGAVALDGLVETDWLPFTFTMSWKITRPFKKIKFETDDPICLIIPVRRHDVESFNPEIRNLESNQELHQQYQTWLERRKQAASHGTHGELAVKGQGQYIRGEQIDGSFFPEHQTKLNVRPFGEVEAQPQHVESATDTSENNNASKTGIWKRLIDR